MDKLAFAYKGRYFAKIEKEHGTYDYSNCSREREAEKKSPVLAVFGFPYRLSGELDL